MFSQQKAQNEQKRCFSQHAEEIFSVSSVCSVGFIS
nr:MAG TPA: hypothetical protein [Caudoviricetes sp.]